MKKIGYKAEFAGAVEAVASSGGQFMPPIMGASAFLIAEIVGIPYWTVAACAAVPAILYYLAVFFVVDFEAGKTGLTGMNKAELPRTRDVLKKGWPSLVSPVVLIVLLAGLQWSPAKAAVWSIAVAFVICMIHKDTRMNLHQIIDTLREGAVGALETTVACAAAGASVCHVDAARGMVSWARENARSSHLEDAPIRWIVDDCAKFVEREIRRGRRYDAIIMDPPSYGRGPSGEVWRLEENLYPFVELVSGVLSDDPLFIVLNSYTTGLAPSVLTYILETLISKRFGGHTVSDELGLPVTQSGLVLPCGATGRWTSSN